MPYYAHICTLVLHDKMDDHCRLDDLKSCSYIGTTCVRLVQDLEQDIVQGL